MSKKKRPHFSVSSGTPRRIPGAKSLPVRMKLNGHWIWVHAAADEETRELCRAFVPNPQGKQGVDNLALAYKVVARVVTGATEDEIVALAPVQVAAILTTVVKLTPGAQ